MELAIDFASISRLLHQAGEEGRDFLYEYEVYSLLAHSGAETPPQALFLARGARPTDQSLQALQGDKVVLKIVSPTIVHKSEIGGVRIVDKEPGKIRATVRRMLYEVPEQFALLLERSPLLAPTSYRGLRGEPLIAAIRQDITGVLAVQYMVPDSEAFGNELIVGLRHTREFGMVISAGLGGTDTELYAERFRKGQAIVASSTEMQDGDSFFEVFRQTIAYRKLAGLTRGQRRIVTDEQLIECFESFIRMANHYSPLNPEADYILDELEVNPFAFSDYLMVPLDGFCRFRKRSDMVSPRPVAKIDNLLHPQRIGLIGVSIKRENFGRLILENVLAEGYPVEQVIVIRDGVAAIDGVRCVPSLSALPGRLDLLVVAVAAEQAAELVAEVVRLDCAESVMLIPGGMGETEDSKQRAERVRAAIRAGRDQAGGGPVFLGANCMGVISRPGRYDTWFIPEEKYPRRRSTTSRRAALISQSGAFMLHRSHQYPELRPAYMISMGNQTDLTLGDMMTYFAAVDHIDVIAIYAEGFNDLDGLAFLQALRQAVVSGKEVVFYKAGRTAEGRAATSGHTASLAGDYMVCESCVRQAGAVVARSFAEFQELFFLAETLFAKGIGGNRLAAVSGAGFEAVGMADSIVSDDYHSQLADLSPVTRERLATLFAGHGLAGLVSISNPLDINPAADDQAHLEVARILLADQGVDALVISLGPLSPSVRTLPAGHCERYDMDQPGAIKDGIITLAAEAGKPVVAVVDGGRLYDPLRDALMRAGLPVFSTCDRAIAALSLYIQGRIGANTLRAEHGANQ